MADQFPCPNPMCIHVFSLAELQAAAQVGCPRCGFRMQGRGPAQPATTKPVAPLVPLAAPVQAPIVAATLAPPATPVQPRAAQARPVAAPVVPPTASEIDVDLVEHQAAPAPRPAASLAGNPFATSPASRSASAQSEAPAPHRAEGLRILLRVVVVLFVIGLSFGVVAAGVGLLVFGLGVNPFVAGHGRDGGFNAADYSVVMGNARNLKGTDEKAFKLLLLKNAWDPDRELKSHFGALGAWVNKQDELWLAIAVKDYGTTRPRDAELLQQAIEKLEGHFGESLELAAKAEPGDLGPAKGQKLTFKGQLGAVVSWGECTMFVHHGFAYWIFLAGPSVEHIQPYAAELKKEESGLSLVTERTGWREQPAQLVTFFSSDDRVGVTAQEGVWEKSMPANVEFETGNLLLLGRYLKEKDNTKNAHLQVFTLEKQKDLKEAMKEAKDFLEKLKKEQNTNYKIGPADEKLSEGGVVEDVGNRKGRVVELMLSHGETPMRYYLLTVVSEPDRVTVVLCDCLWRSRQIWRQDFLDLLKSYKAKAKAS